MSKFIKAALASSVIAASVMGASAAQAATANGTATAEILTPITVSPVDVLDFGTILQTGSAQSVSEVTAGTFAVTADASKTLDVTSDSSVTLYLGGVVGAASMSASLSPDTTVATNASGTGSFAVGGTLSVLGTETDGAYSGTYSVTVEYQ